MLHQQAAQVQVAIAGGHQQGRRAIGEHLVAGAEIDVHAMREKEIHRLPVAIEYRRAEGFPAMHGHGVPERLDDRQVLELFRTAPAGRRRRRPCAGRGCRRRGPPDTASGPACRSGRPAETRARPRGSGRRRASTSQCTDAVAWAASASMSGVPWCAGPARWRSRYRSLRPGRCPARRRRPPAAPPRTAARSRNCRCRRSSPSGGTPVVSWARAGMAARRAGRAGSGHPSTRVAGPRLPRRLRQVKRKRGPEFPDTLRAHGGAVLSYHGLSLRLGREQGGCMGTAKYDHPGYVADTGDAGKYHVGIWCPHGYPAHIHIGRPADGGDPWRCCACAYRTACSSRWPTIPRRCAGGRSDRRWARACCAPWRWTATTRRSVSNSTPSPGRPHAAARA